MIEGSPRRRGRRGGRLWLRLGSGRLRAKPEEAHCPRGGHAGHELAPGDGSSLQLLLELVEEAPVRALRDDLLRRGSDHAGLAQAERLGLWKDRHLVVVRASSPEGYMVQDQSNTNSFDSPRHRSLFFKRNP